jgi:Protein of unknown function (DUF2793)/C1q domain
MIEVRVAVSQIRQAYGRGIAAEAISMAKTPHLNLRFIAPAQAQKHVTVNESLAALDSLVQCAAIEFHRNDPPSGPSEGDRYVVGSAPTGDWAGKAKALAAWQNGGWEFHTPQPGWRVHNLADGALYVLNAARAWMPVAGLPASGAALQNAELIGLGTTANSANPFAAKLNAVLWTARTTAEGGSGDLVYKMNKAASGRDLGYLFQTDFVTKALAGLFGSDRFRISVSADGSSFFDGVSVDNATGIVDQPQLPRFKGFTDFDNYVGLDSWTKIAINRTETNNQGAFDAAANHFVAPVAGTYIFGASLLYKVNNNSSSRMRARLVLNGTTEIKGTLGEISGAHVSLATSMNLQTLVPLAKGDTVELQGFFRSADGYFAADHTTFWGCKIG